jgi:hypothetical protein
MAEFSLYLLVCVFQLSATFFSNFIFASDKTPEAVNQGRFEPQEFIAGKKLPGRHKCQGTTSSRAVTPLY